MGFSNLSLTDIKRVFCSKATLRKRALKVCFFKLLSSSVLFSLFKDVFLWAGHMALTHKLEPLGWWKLMSPGARVFIWWLRATGVLCKEPSLQPHVLSVLPQAVGIRS